VDDHGTEIDERAAAALRALSEGRGASVGERSLAGRSERWAAVVRVVDELGAMPRRLATLAFVSGLVRVVGALAWLALRPVGASEGATGDLFAGSAVTVPGAAGADRDPGAVGATITTTAGSIVVHAAGAVSRPGLYRLPRGSRVADLLDAAGGPTLETDLDRVNLAAPLADGQRLYLPRRGEVSPSVVGPDGGAGSGGGAGPGASGSASASAPIDLNTATAEQLDALPGVGPATAAAIVAHRERNGPFTSIEGLLDVRGIGPAKLEAIRDLAAVG
jgi:competence protein ComEA